MNNSILDIRFFNAYHFEKNKQLWNEYIETIPRVPDHKVMAVYFDDDADAYQVFTRYATKKDESFTEVKDIYSWDELSAYIHNTIY